MSIEGSIDVSTVVTTQANSNVGTQLVMSTRCVMRPPVYQPGTDLAQYLLVYERVASANGWSDQQKKNYLIVCFPGGSPLQQACIASPSTQSYEALSLELRQMLSAHMDQVKLAEFQQRTKKETESVGEFERSLRELYLAALGSDATPDSDILYMNRFMEGLPSRWRTVLAREMYKKVPDSLAHAQRLEAAEKLHGTSIDTVYPAAWAASVQSLGSASTDNSRIVQLEAKMDTLTTLMQQLLQVQLSQAQGGRSDRVRSPGECSPAHQGRPPRRHFSPRVPRRSLSRGRLYCSYCRKQGHSIEWCRRLQGTLCESCGKRGHTTQYCQQYVPSRRAPAPGHMTRPRSPPQSGN